MAETHQTPYRFFLPGSGMLPCGERPFKTQTRGSHAKSHLKSHPVCKNTPRPHLGAFLVCVGVSRNPFHHLRKAGQLRAWAHLIRRPRAPFNALATDQSRDSVAGLDGEGDVLAHRSRRDEAIRTLRRRQPGRVA